MSPLSSAIRFQYRVWDHSQVTDPQQENNTLESVNEVLTSCHSDKETLLIPGLPWQEVHLNAGQSNEYWFTDSNP